MIEPAMYYDERSGEMVICRCQSEIREQDLGCEYQVSWFLNHYLQLWLK